MIHKCLKCKKYFYCTEHCLHNKESLGCCCDTCEVPRNDGFKIKCETKFIKIRERKKGILIGERVIQ